MSRRVSNSETLRYLFLLLAILGSSASCHKRDSPPEIKNADEYAWQLFAKINARAGDPGNYCEDVAPPAGNQDDGTPDACWQRWANSVTDVYVKNQSEAIVWPTRSGADQGGVTPSFFRVYNNVLSKSHALSKIPPGTPAGLIFSETLDELQKLERGDLTENEDVQEVRFNKPAFDYIAQHHLWNKQGLRDAARLGTPLQFPWRSVVVKAAWQGTGCNPVGAATCPEIAGYIWRVLKSEDSTRVYKLAALHIISKVLPNWLWATWEHQKNDMRCDEMPCRDSFGHPKGFFGQPSRELESLLKPLGNWQSYRLRGTQVNYTDAAGRPIFLANSVIEAGQSAFKGSSCMTCHAQAVADTAGGIPRAKPAAAGWPPPDWFQPNDSPLALDFLWSPLIEGQAKSSTP